MRTSRQQPISALIERSSLGSRDARLTRSRIPLADGQAIVRAAAARRKPSGTNPSETKNSGIEPPGGPTTK